MLRFKFLLLICIPFSINAQPNNGFKNEYAALGTFYESGEYRLALDICEGIISADSGQENAWLYKAFIHMKQKKNAEAATAFRKLAGINPQIAGYWNDAGWFSILSGQYDSAIVYCNRSISLNGENYSPYLNKAHAYLKKGAFHEADYWYKLTAEMIPNRDALINGPLADMDLLDSLQDSPFTEIVKELFAETYMKAEKNTASNILLDSIYRVSLGKEDNKSARILDLKKRFIAAQRNESVQRTRLLAYYSWDVGREEFYNNNVAKSFQDYLSVSIRYTTELRDSIFLYSQYYTLSEDIMTVMNRAYKGTTNDDAVFFAQQAVRVAEEYKLEKMKPHAYFQLGEAFTYLERPGDAIPNYLQVLKIYGKSIERRYYQNVLNRLMLCYNDVKKIDSFSYYYRLLINDLKESKDYGERYILAKKNYMTTMYNFSRYNLVVSSFPEFIKEFGTRNDHLQEIARVYNLGGSAYYKLGKMDSAFILFTRSLDLYMQHSDEFQKNNPGKRTGFIAEELSSAFESLLKMQAEKGKKDEFFELSERSKENLLHYLLTLENQPKKVIGLHEMQQKLPADAVGISFVNGNDRGLSLSIGFSREQSLLSEHRHTTVEKELVTANKKFNLGALLAEKQQQSLSINNYLLYQMLPMIYYFQNLNDLAVSRGLGRKKTADSSAISPTARVTVSKLLYQLYIKPYESLLEGKKRLYISADHALHFFPFETLMDEKGKYLGEKYIIVYVPSFTIQGILEKRNYNKSGKILAFGNADYTTYHPEKLNGKAFDYATTSISNWSELEGTAKELNMLKNLVTGIEVIGQGQVSETNLKKMNREKKLESASIIHFALHGFTNVTIGMEENSLIITEPDNGKEDGYLQFYEIYNLDIKPRLVCLSACETSFGVPREDGSNISMSTAFLAAGAASCIGSNWKVSDEATGLFMKEFYTLVAQGKDYDESLFLTRKKFIEGEMGQAFRSPYFWAPFKYYGF